MRQLAVLWGQQYKRKNEYIPSTYIVVWQRQSCGLKEMLYYYFFYQSQATRKCAWQNNNVADFELDFNHIFKDVDVVNEGLEKRFQLWLTSVQKTRSTHYSYYLIMIYFEQSVRRLVNMFLLIILMKYKLIVFLLHILNVYVLSKLSFKCTCYFYNFVVPSQSN